MSVGLSERAMIGKYPDFAPATLLIPEPTEADEPVSPTEEGREMAIPVTNYRCGWCDKITGFKLTNPLERWLLTCEKCNRYSLHQRLAAQKERDHE